MSGNNGSGKDIRAKIQITVLGDVDVQLVGQRLMATAKYWKGTHCHAFCPGTGGDVYVWWENINMDGRKKLEPGQDFEFTLGHDGRSARAYNVQPLPTFWSHWTNDQWEKEKQPA